MEIDLLIDLHKKASRQGPGSEKVTLRAIECIDTSQNPDLNILDIGCGSGGQTLTLAKHIQGQITAVDLFPEFLKELNKRAQKLNLKNQITSVEASMENLPFEAGSFDIIWSEGAIYIMGFQAGIEKWKEYLKEGGYVAISEVTWITQSRPKAVEDFWRNEYPEIDTAANKIKQLEDLGFTLTGYFVLSEDCWMQNYYLPLEESFEAFLERNDHSELANKVVDEHRTEINFYRTYKDYFSYGFYVARKK